MEPKACLRGNEDERKYGGEGKERERGVNRRVLGLRREGKREMIVCDNYEKVSYFKSVCIRQTYSTLICSQ